MAKAKLYMATDREGEFIDAKGRVVTIKRDARGLATISIKKRLNGVTERHEQLPLPMVEQPDTDDLTSPG